MSGERSGEPDELGQQGRLRLPALGRILGEPLADLAAAAAFLRRVLPEIAADLAAIRSHVGSMDPEMVGMHASAERIEGEMGDLNARIGDLAERMAAVERAVVRLEPHVADVNLAVRPLRRAWARVRRVPDGEAQYGVLCREDGGVLDDLFTYRLADCEFLTVTNAANHEKDLAWMQTQAEGFDVDVVDRAADFAMLAVQGPEARDVVT